MNFPIVLRLLSLILLVVSLFMLFPMAFGLAYGEISTLSAFYLPMAATILIAVVVLLLTSRIQRNRFSYRDAFFFVSVSWIGASLLGAMPFVISGYIPRIADAFFETMSGFTTTGATILTEIESLPKSILFWRSLTHWLGGMGIVVLIVAIFPMLGMGGFQVVKAEMPGPSVDRITPKITGTAKILWFIYMGLTVLETALLMLGGMSFFDALTHTFGTLATGGFSPKNPSVGFYQSGYIDAVITVFMLMAGINFNLYFRLLSGKISDLVQNTELKAYLLIFFIATALMTLDLSLHGGMTPRSGLRYASFQAATILTTTGFVTADYSLWPSLSQGVLFILMFIGGCAGSTGGGVKVVRIVILLKQGLNEMRRLIHPRGVFTIRINKKGGRKDIVYAVSGFVFLYAAALLLTTLVVAGAGNDIATSISTALVTLGNIGPGFGKIGPVFNYAFLPEGVKWYLSFIMMAGRLELFTVLILFMPGFWKK